jgi:aspartyl-tRNA(Asn)/glutamyl-tRNA(Gln) amidotransferase subunit C
VESIERRSTRIIIGIVIEPNFSVIFMLDREQVRKVAHLARLDVTPAEEEQLSLQLSQILDYFEQLNELDTTNVPPTTRAIELSNITRSDRLNPFPYKEDLLEQAPKRDDDYFRVPKILSTDES